MLAKPTANPLANDKIRILWWKIFPTIQHWLHSKVQALIIDWKEKNENKFLEIKNKKKKKKIKKKTCWLVNYFLPS